MQKFLGILEFLATLLKNSRIPKKIKNSRIPKSRIPKFRIPSNIIKKF